MPKHGHEALEATLVLHGGYCDEKGDYNKGDLVVAKVKCIVLYQLLQAVFVSCLLWIFTV